MSPKDRRALAVAALVVVVLLLKATLLGRGGAESRDARDDPVEAPTRRRPFDDKVDDAIRRAVVIAEEEGEGSRRRPIIASISV